jgi:hypothetical protein
VTGPCPCVAGSRRRFGSSKNPRLPARVLGSGLASLALVPWSSLPPGAGNEGDYALNAELERAEKSEEGYVYETEVVRRDLHAATVRPDQDGDVAAIAAIEQAQRGLRSDS